MSTNEMFAVAFALIGILGLLTSALSFLMWLHVRHHR